MCQACTRSPRHCRRSRAGSRTRRAARSHVHPRMHVRGRVHAGAIRVLWIDDARHRSYHGGFCGLTMLVTVHTMADSVGRRAIRMISEDFFKAHSLYQYAFTLIPPTTRADSKSFCFGTQPYGRCRPISGAARFKKIKKGTWGTCGRSSRTRSPVARASVRCRGPSPRHRRRSGRRR